MLIPSVTLGTSITGHNFRAAASSNQAADSSLYNREWLYLSLEHEDKSWAKGAINPLMLTAYPRILRQF